MDVLTDFPERIRAGKTVYVGEKYQPVKITHVRSQNRALLISLEGCNTPEDVARYRNLVVYVPTKEVPKLPEGEYYHHEILGASVVDQNGVELGSLYEILETGANEVYVVKSPEGKEILLPAIESVILSISLEKKLVTVHPPEWE